MTINRMEQRLKGKTNEERLHLLALFSKFLQKYEVYGRTLQQETKVTLD